MRCGDLAKQAPCRYVSKNNANVARLPLLTEMFPDCSLVIALRRPSAHAASLLRQHENFLRLHKEDPFTKACMRDIGHLRPGRGALDPLGNEPAGFGPPAALDALADAERREQRDEPPGTQHAMRLACALVRRRRPSGGSSLG